MLSVPKWLKNKQTKQTNKQTNNLSAEINDLEIENYMKLSQTLLFSMGFTRGGGCCEGFVLHVYHKQKKKTL